MPVEHAVTIHQGTTEARLLVFLRDAADPGRGKTGLRAGAEGSGCAFIREGEAAPTPVELTDGDGPGSFAEVDPERLPGVYRLGVPDELPAPGSARAVLLFRFPGAVVRPIEIDLVAYDPQETWCIGLAELSNEKRHKFLHAAMPDMSLDTYGAGDEIAARLDETTGTVSGAGVRVGIDPEGSGGA